MTDPDRVIRLEETLTHLEHHVLEQDKVIMELADELKRLRQEIGALGNQLQVTRSPTEIPADERPPHY